MTSLLILSRCWSTGSSWECVAPFFSKRSGSLFYYWSHSTLHLSRVSFSFGISTSFFFSIYSICQSTVFFLNLDFIYMLSMYEWISNFSIIQKVILLHFGNMFTTDCFIFPTYSMSIAMIIFHPLKPCKGPEWLNLVSFIW